MKRRRLMPLSRETLTRKVTATLPGSDKKGVEKRGHKILTASLEEMIRRRQNFEKQKISKTSIHLLAARNKYLNA